MAEKKEKKDKTPEKKPEKEKKVSVFQRASRSLREMKGEMKKVVWPSKKQIINNTGIVIIVVAISGVAIGLLDSLLKLGVYLLLRAA